ncbi:MAG: hypothetical protein U0169_13825 [Polyangiaceae bacterium]
MIPFLVIAGAVATLPIAGTLVPSTTLASPGARAILPPLPLTIRVVTDGDAGVVDAAWLDEQVAAANRHFARFGIRFTVTLGATIPAKHLALESRADRDVLSTYMTPGTLDVFVVGSLRDVDEPPRLRKGVTWRRTDDTSKRFVILSSAAFPDVLAHELGHFLGNGHSAVTDNLMSYSRDGGTVFLDDAQGERSRREAARLFATRRLVARADASVDARSPD